jgi:repressor LexA
MSLGEIIRNKREELGLTLDEVSRRVGFSKPYLSTIETRKVKNPPSRELLRKLEQVLKFDPGLLLHIANVERLPTDIKEKLERGEAENEKWRRLFRKLMSAISETSPKGGSDKTGMERLSKLLDKSELELPVQAGSESLAAGRLVPIINRVSAGYPADFDDLEYPVGVADDYVRCPDLHDPNAFAVRVVGDSMEPKYKQGDIVLFSPAAEVSSGDDCFVRFSSPHETTFKRVFLEPNEMIRLQPRNEKYPPTIVESKRINGLYRAIAKIERL